MQCVCKPLPAPSPSPSGDAKGAAPGAPGAGTGCAPTGHPNPEGIAPVTWERMTSLRGETAWESGRAVHTRTHGCSTERCRRGWQKGGQQRPCFAVGPWGGMSACMCVCKLGPGAVGCSVSPRHGSRRPLTCSTNHFAASPVPHHLLVITRCSSQMSRRGCLLCIKGCTISKSCLQKKTKCSAALENLASQLQPSSPLLSF